MDIFWAVLLVCVALLLWALNLINLPGNWLVMGAAGLYAYLTPAGGRADVGWPVVIALLVLAVVGEVIEFAAGAAGAARVGGSRRSAVLALRGSRVGGVAGIFVGAAIPIPLIGSLIGALLLGGLGALLGAVAGERWKGRPLDASLRVGQAAFWGRLAGTLGKIVVGAAMIAVLLAGLVL